jgi:hypothetical protein
MASLRETMIRIEGFIAAARENLAWAEDNLARAEAAFTAARNQADQDVWDAAHEARDEARNRVLNCKEALSKHMDSYYPVRARYSQSKRSAA